MPSPLAGRLEDLLQATADIRVLLDGKTLEKLAEDRISRAAYERFLEIVSEASRHVPDARKRDYPGIPWQEIAALGNRLRHAYWALDAGILWAIYADGHLDELERAVTEIKQSLQGRI
jgi:uncharacterized protein with HEPN domain